MLWPELGQANARAALRKAIYALRAALGSGIVLSRGDEEVALSADELWCDVAAFTAAADAAALTEALELYRGELLPGFHLAECLEFDEWLEEQRATALERASGAAWALAQRLEKDAQFSDAGTWARRAARFSRTDERALRRAIQMLHRLGDRAGAVQLYDEFARRLKTDLEVDPSPETVALIERVKGPSEPT
jgi:DNA-binding SARP family transcriptional activator